MEKFQLKKINFQFDFDYKFENNDELFGWLKNKYLYIKDYVSVVYADDTENRQDEGNQSFSLDSIDDFDSFIDICKNKAIDFICFIAEIPEHGKLFLSASLDRRTARLGMESSKDEDVSFVEKLIHEEIIKLGWKAINNENDKIILIRRMLWKN